MPRYLVEHEHSAETCPTSNPGLAVLRVCHRGAFVIVATPVRRMMARGQLIAVGAEAAEYDAARASRRPLPRQEEARRMRS
jgi:hypothetical protein